MRHASFIVSRPCFRDLVLGLSLLLWALNPGFAAAADDPVKPADPDDSTPKTAETQPFVGKFVGDGLTVIIQSTDGDYYGRITRATKDFEFTGKLNKDVLHASFKIDDTPTTFTASFEGETLKISMGFDSYKLARVGVPTGNVRGNTVRTALLVAKVNPDMIVNSALASPDNRRVAYVVLRNGIQHLAVDGVEGKPYKRIETVLFSPDSKHVCAIVRLDDEKLAVVVDGVQGEAVDDLGDHVPVFSKDSKRLAYAARAGDKWYAVIDRERSKPYEKVKALTFSADGRRFAFAGLKDGHWRVVVDGVEHSPIPDLESEFIQFSADGKKVIYTVVADGRQSIYFNGIPGKSHDAVIGLTFSENGEHHSCIVVNQQRMSVLVDGEEVGTFDSVQGVTFSPDGSRYAIGIRENGKAHAIVDGQREPAFDHITQPIFSLDGRHLAYLVKIKNKWHVALKGRISEGHDQIHYLTFSPNSRRLAYAAIDAKSWTIMVDGKPLDQWDRVWNRGVRFSPDSRHVVVTAGRGNEAYVSVNGIEGDPVGDFIRGSEAIFDGPNQFRILVRREGGFHQLDVKITD